MRPAMAVQGPGGPFQPYDPQVRHVVVHAPPTNSLAVMSLVFGIVSWVLCPIIGGLVAVITGHAARGQISRTGEGGGGLALAGLILGYFNLAVVGVGAILWVLFVLILGVAMTGTHPAGTP
jgi:hypothetical protein